MKRTFTGLSYKTLLNVIYVFAKQTVVMYEPGNHSILSLCWWIKKESAQVCSNLSRGRNGKVGLEKGVRVESSSLFHFRVEKFYDRGQLRACVQPKKLLTCCNLAAREAEAAANVKFEQRLSFLNGVIEFKWLLNKVHTHFINETN